LESFDQLAQKYTPMIYKIINILNIYKNKDEFFQLGLIALWEASKRYTPSKGNFTPFAYNYVRGCLLNEIKQQNVHDEKNTVAKEEFWDALEDYLAAIPFEEELILTFCSGLTENQTKWVLYTALKNFTIKEIAEVENVSMSAVKAWRAGAKEKLKRQVKIV
jgi:RNA polymerase sigma factor (sigma-70 family)